MQRSGPIPGMSSNSVGTKVVLEQGEVDFTSLSQYSVEELRSMRHEMYKYAKSRHMGSVYIGALTMLNTELAMRQEPLMKTNE